jgi:hypothetical protein
MDQPVATIPDRAVPTSAATDESALDQALARLASPESDAEAGIHVFNSQLARFEPRAH